MNDKSIVLRLCLICLPGDTNEHLLTLTGSVYQLTVRLFINEVAVNGSNGILLDGYVRAKINCRDQTVTVQSISNIPEESICSTGSCLGKFEFNRLYNSHTVRYYRTRVLPDISTRICGYTRNMVSID